MVRKNSLAPLSAVLEDLTAWLKFRQVPNLIIGGVAASLLGRPRVTQDVDVLVIVDEGGWDDFLKSGKYFGFTARRSDALGFAKKTRVLLVRHRSGIDVDIVFAGLSFETEIIARSITVKLGKITLPVPAPEDLVIMKAVSNRPRDLADIESILDAHPKLSLRRVRRLVRGFSLALEMPAILNHLEMVLAKKRKRPLR
jgi:hypothetical protein